MNRITEQEWERYQGEIDSARRRGEPTVRPLAEATAAYRDEITVTHQQLLDHDGDVIRRFVTRLIGRIRVKGYDKAIPEVAAEFGFKDHLDILVPTMHVDERRAVRKFATQVRRLLLTGGGWDDAMVMLHEAMNAGAVAPDVLQPYRRFDTDAERTLLYKIMRCLSELNRVHTQIASWGVLPGLRLHLLQSRKDELNIRRCKLREELRQYE